MAARAPRGARQREAGGWEWPPVPVMRQGGHPAGRPNRFDSGGDFWYFRCEASTVPRWLLGPCLPTPRVLWVWRSPGHKAHGFGGG